MSPAAYRCTDVRTKVRHAAARSLVTAITARMIAAHDAGDMVAGRDPIEGRMTVDMACIGGLSALPPGYSAAA